MARHLIAYLRLDEEYERWERPVSAVAELTAEQLDEGWDAVRNASSGIFGVLIAQRTAAADPAVKAWLRAHTGDDRAHQLLAITRLSATTPQLP